MKPYETYRAAFLRFVANGMTHAEALAEFDIDKWNAAMWEELEVVGRHYDTGRHEWVNNDGTASLLDLAALAHLQERNSLDSRDGQQMLDLYQAGWTSEVPDSGKHNSQDPWRQQQIMSLYWRRPPRRAGKPGRKYLSTNQAWQAMHRELNESTTSALPNARSARK